MIADNILCSSFITECCWHVGSSGALAGVMASRYKRTGKVFPAGVVSLVSLVMAGGYLHGIMRTTH